MPAGRAAVAERVNELTEASVAKCLTAVTMQSPADSSLTFGRRSWSWELSALDFCFFSLLHGH